MSKPALAPLERQLRRVTRRLFAQTFLDRLTWCWAGALALAACWLLLRPLLAPAEGWLDWPVAGGLVVLATCLATALALRAAPSRLAVALELDDRFELRERVTTSLSLPPGQEDSPAAQALLADVNRRVAGLDVPTRFPVRLSWSAALVPLGAAALAAIAFFYNPGPSTASPNPDAGDRQADAGAKELEQKLAHIKKQLKKEWPKDRPKSKEMQELEKLWEKLLNQPLDPNDKDKLRERVQQLRPVEKKLQERIADLRGKADKLAQLKDQLKNLDKADPNALKKGAKEGPGKDVRDALAKGNFEKAAEEVEKLRKKLDKNQMNPEEKQKLEQEMRDLERQLKRLGDMQDLRDRLKEALDKGELAREEFDQQMQELQDMAGDLKDLQDLADALGECLKCMGKGDKLGAGKKLKLIAAKLKKMEGEGKELKDLLDNEQALCEAQEAMLMMLMCKQGQGQGQGKNQGNGLGGGRLPGRERPITKKGPADFNDARQKGGQDEKGQWRISGFRKGGTFSKIPAREVGSAFRQAQQEAPGAIERQRVPPDAADILKGYYENLGGQK